MAKAKHKNGSKPDDVEEVDNRPAIYLNANDEKRLRSFPSETYYNLDTRPRSQLDFLAHFMTRTGKAGSKYLPKDEALAILFQYNMGEIADIMQQFQGSVDEGVFPK